MMLRMEDRKWYFVLQMLYRFYEAPNVKQFQQRCFEQLQFLIPFSKGVFYLARREEDRIIHHSPVGFHMEANSGMNAFMEASYPNNWEEIQRSPWSSVRRNSEIYGSSQEFEGSVIYQELYLPCDIYHALQVVLTHQDHLLGILALFRPQSSPNFSDSEVEIVNLIKDHLALQLYRLTGYQQPRTPVKLASTCGLSQRETEIAAMIIQEKSREDICRELFISIPTLRKHLNNMYRKTGTKGFLQLYRFLTEIGQD